MKEDIFYNDYVMPGGKADQTCVLILKVPKGFKPEGSVSFLLEKYQSLKGLFQNIDFECNIQPNGSCKNHSTNRCCCYDCKNNIGYIHIMFENQIPYYAKKFNGKTGFWRKGKGCILPHHLRSITCLTHHCNYKWDGYKSNKHFPKGMTIIRETLKDIRKEIEGYCNA
jgi:hypothetical protein